MIAVLMLDIDSSEDWSSIVSLREL